MFNFTDRQSYIIYRAEWKAQYKFISSEIRRLKSERNNLFRTRSILTIIDMTTWKILWNVLRDLAANQTTAREMLEERVDSKIRAGELRKENQHD